MYPPEDYQGTSVGEGSVARHASRYASLVTRILNAVTNELLFRVECGRRLKA